MRRIVIKREVPPRVHTDDADVRPHMAEFMLQEIMTKVRDMTSVESADKATYTITARPETVVVEAEF